LLDFRRLRASDLKAATGTNEKNDDNASGKKRKAQASEVNNQRWEIVFEIRIVIIFRLKNRKNLQHQVRNECDHLMRK
jgi:predicted RNase H-like nuclease